MAACGGAVMAASGDPAAATAGPAEREFSLVLSDGASLAYARAGASETSGERPVVLLLHGLASNRSRWWEFAQRTSLTRRFAVLRIDLRGHGQSQFTGRLSLERWCDDLCELLDALGAGRAILIGHSLGAQIALAFAARYPRRTAAIALVDPVFRAALRGKWRIVAMSGPLLATAAALVRAANALGLRRRVVLPYDLVALDAQARAALGSKAARAAFIRRYSSTRADLRHFRTAHYLQELVEMFRPAPILRTLDVAALVLLSTAGTFADAGATQRLLGELPRGLTAWIDCQHWPLTEKPDEVRAAIERWCVALPERAPHDRKSSRAQPGRGREGR